MFKTLRPCMILGCRQVESKHAHLWQKCIFFLFRISLINWLNLEPKSDEKMMYTRTIDQRWISPCMEAPGASQGLSRDLRTHRHHFGSFFSQKIKLCFHSFVSIEFDFFSGCQKLSFSGDQTIIQEINPSHLIYTFICISVCTYVYSYIYIYICMRVTICWHHTLD